VDDRGLHLARAFCHLQNETSCDEADRNCSILRKPTRRARFRPRAGSGMDVPAPSDGPGWRATIPILSRCRTLSLIACCNRVRSNEARAGGCRSVSVFGRTERPCRAAAGKPDRAERGWALEPPRMTGSDGRCSSRSLRHNSPRRSAKESPSNGHRVPEPVASTTRLLPSECCARPLTAAGSWWAKVRRVNASPIRPNKCRRIAEVQDPLFTTSWELGEMQSWGTRIRSYLLRISPASELQCNSIVYTDTNDL
jgi:hypothetical protein